MTGNVDNAGIVDFNGRAADNVNINLTSADAVANLIGNIISWFLSLGKIVTKIIDAIILRKWLNSGVEIRASQKILQPVILRFNLRAQTIKCFAISKLIKSLGQIVKDTATILQ